MPIALVVHGGAWNIPDESVHACLAGVRAALEHGWQALRGGAAALDVIEATVRVLEDDPAFNAGRGSRLNNAGEVELDASIMEGSGLDAGAVAAVRGLLHPVSVARKVMTDSPHVLLVGDGARDFATGHGAELCETLDLLVGRERDRYLRVRDGERHLVEREFGDLSRDDEHSTGTVGAVAVDARGRVAAATSTGGSQDKAPGRVGDTPVIGAGTFADDTMGAASATGWGEGILRVALAKAAVDLMGSGSAPDQAGRHAIRTLDRIGGKAGLILVAPDGRVAATFNTPRMARGWITDAGGLEVHVEPTDAAR